MKLQASIDDDRVVRVYDVVETERDLLLIMEYCQGNRRSSGVYNVNDSVKRWKLVGMDKEKPTSRQDKREGERPSDVALLLCDVVDRSAHATGDMQGGFQLPQQKDCASRLEAGERVAGW